MGRRAGLALPAPEDAFPASTTLAFRLFWIRYWAWFFLMLPWMLVRQVGLGVQRGVGALWTWNRTFSLLGGRLDVLFIDSLPSLAVQVVFGERFTAIRYRDVLIDPGPPFGAKRLAGYLEGKARPAAVVATHSHEEHIGNVAALADASGAPVHATNVTLERLLLPERLPLMRRLFIGQPEPCRAATLRRLESILSTPEARLRVIESPGHCEGHASLFDESHGLLFAGDSFLHAVFTAPNRDVRGEDWIATLRKYLELDIRTMVGTHGLVSSIDPELPPMRFVVERVDPRRLIRDKLDFMLWAQEVVARGEARGLPYSIIEASLFPWGKSWTWQNWFTDESGRLFTAGEFSRTYFVRSLSKTPEKVPPRFPPFARLAKAASFPKS